MATLLPLFILVLVMGLYPNIFLDVMHCSCSNLVQTFRLFVLFQGFSMSCLTVSFFILFMNNLFMKTPSVRSPGSRHKRVVKTKMFGVSRKADLIKHNVYSEHKKAGRNHHGHITV
jgi:hypothetical protein